MDAVRSTTWLISLGLHAGLLVAIIGVTPGGAALESGTGDDMFVVEQGIALEGVVKLGEAEEMFETIDIPPIQKAQIKPPEETDIPPEEETPMEMPQEVEPELTEVITSKESEHEDPIEEREPEPVLEKEEIPEGVPMEERPAQIATVMLKSSGLAQAGGDATQRRAYLGQLRRLLEHNKVNPRSRQSGTVLLIFTVDPSGQLISRKVKKSSGSKLLDDAAMAALDRAAPFPPMPENVAQGPLEVQVPFKFITR